MDDPSDIVDIEGVPGPPARRSRAAKGASPRPWLGVHFRCCNVYGRMYRTRDGHRYEGHCPGCGAPVRALIGRGGTSRRMFVAE